MSLSVIKVYSSDAAANIALGVLRTNGIPAVLNNEITSNVFGIQLAPFDGIRLLVNDEDRDIALRLLDHPDEKYRGRIKNGMKRLWLALILLLAVFQAKRLVACPRLDKRMGQVP